MPPSKPMLRPATADDSRGCFDLFWTAIGDLAARKGMPWEGTADDRWPDFEQLYDFLAAIAAEWWVAEDESGRLAGYARSIERGADHGMLELSEFFVHPGAQSNGLGRRLLERAFPLGRGDVRVIVATADVRAVARYHAADTAIQFPILGMNGPPSPDAAAALGLHADRITDADGLEAVAVLEREVVGRDRGEQELRWLLETREGYLYRDSGPDPIGFGFVGQRGVGPIATRDPAHLPDVLDHIVSRGAAVGRDELNFEVPAPNVVAIRHLLARGYRFDPFVTFLMANRPFGRFDRYLGFTPPFIL